MDLTIPGGAKGCGRKRGNKGEADAGGTDSGRQEVARVPQVYPREET